MCRMVSFRLRLKREANTNLNFCRPNAEYLFILLNFAVSFVKEFDGSKRKKNKKKRT